MKHALFRESTISKEHYFKRAQYQESTLRKPTKACSVLSPIKTMSNLCGIFGETLMASATDGGFEEIPIKTRTIAFLTEHRHHILPYTREERTMEEEILDKLKKIHR